MAPVPIQLDRLYTALRRSHPEFDTAPFQEPIERGITRVFEYVNARLQAAATLDPANSTFELTGLLQTFKDITCAGDLSESVFVQGVRERFAQSVVAELQRNAQPHATFLTVHRKSREVVLEVEDEGPGIESSDLAYVFVRGFSKRGGSGHGLALVKEIVEIEMGGRIVVGKSSRGGARFTLTLPRTLKTS